MTLSWNSILNFMFLVRMVHSGRPGGLKVKQQSFLAHTCCACLLAHLVAWGTGEDLTCSPSNGFPASISDSWMAHIWLALFQKVLPWMGHQSQQGQKQQNWHRLRFTLVLSSILRILVHSYSLPLHIIFPYCLSYMDSSSNVRCKVSILIQIA